MNIVLGFVFLLCLLLLVMIFGEQLSILGAFHGRWLNALAESVADLCDFLWDEVDRTWGFVLEHVWWVLAVGSGSMGGLIVAWMMFGGVADQAAADLAGRAGRLQAGGILDQVPEIDSQVDLLKASFDEDEEPIARRTYQVPSRHLLATDRGRWGQPVLGRDDTELSDLPPWPERRPDLRNEFEVPERRDWELPGAERDRLSTLLPEERFRPRRISQSFGEPVQEINGDQLAREDDRITSVRGTTVVAGTLKREIESALRRLEFERTRWRRHDRFASSRRETDEFSRNPSEVREATDAELGELESGIQIVSGPGIAESELSIEKQLLATDHSSQFDIEIRVTNRSRRRMSGLLVREQLPFGVTPVDVNDAGIYRDATVTWVIDDLPPRSTQVVRARVRSDSAESFTTHTEISAVAAVSSEVYVESDRRTDFSPGQPSVRLTAGQIPREVDVAEKLEIPFRLRNTGTAAAAEVVLRIDLPVGLDHFHLNDSDLDRSVLVTVRNLEPGQTRNVTLKVRATESGDQEAVIELLVDHQQVDLDTFRVRVREQADEDLGPLLPEPDNGIPRGRR